MDTYIIHTHFEEEYNAGTKARADINEMAGAMGFLPLVIRKRYLKGHMKNLRQVAMLLSDLLRIFAKPKRNSLIFFQVPLPFAGKQTRIIYIFFRILKWAKNIKVMMLAIDIDTFRRSDDMYIGEWNILRIADGLILHTQPMLRKYKERVNWDQKVELINIFDYLSDFNPNSRERKLTNQVIFAGNLMSDKAGFINDLGKVGTGTVFNLYGRPEFKSDSPDVRYMGSAPSEEIIHVIEGSFGLVWDGYSIDTCSREIGKYLEINCPSKTSLYLAAGLPVIIWKKAAMAELIEGNNLGFAVDSLREISGIINDMSENDYSLMRKNVLEYSSKLSKGWFFRDAVRRLTDSMYEKV